MLGLVHDVAVESRHEGNLACVVDGRNAIFYKAEVGMSHVGDVFHVQTEFVSSRRGDFRIPIGDTRFHVEASVETVYIPLSQIQLLIDKAQADTAPVRSIGNACVEPWKTVLPPAYTGFVQKCDACHECAAIAVATVWLFKISPLSETAVPKTEYAFRPSHAVGLKTIFYNIPFVSFKVFLHGSLFLCYRCKDKQIKG